MTAHSGQALRIAYLVAAVAGVAFFAMSVVLLAVWPGRVLGEQSRAMKPTHVLALSEAELRGRRVYSREGCAYCHTQQIRYLHTDMTRFGAPTLAWETQADYPHLWGTRRIGPDLSRESAARPEDWQYAHLYAPRIIVAGSVMPAYPWLFEGSPERPRQDARDLVAYLDTLGRARAVAGPEADERARAACRCAGDEMAEMAFSLPLSAHPARTRPRGNAPGLPPAGDLELGRRLFASNCANCHGASGNGRADTGLHPSPARLAEHDYSRTRLADVLWNGMAGTAMPAWRDHSPGDLAAMAEAVRELGPRQPAPAVPADVLALGADVYAANCAQCHGANGGGDGTAARELRIAPTDFRAQRATLDAAVRALRLGLPGTQMAAWGQRLSDADIVAAAHYVRSLYAGDDAARKRPQ